MEQKLGSSSRDTLATPVEGGHSLTTQERQAVDLASTIPGWGSDLDRAKRPGVPRDKAPDIGVEHLYPPIEPQVATFTIHKSTEHARLTPVFGTSCPPTGISGKVRDAAYKLSEGRLSRWMALMAADRIDMVEGVIGDLARFQVPDLVAETGLKSELKYNRPGVIKKVAVMSVVVLAFVALARSTRHEQ